MTGAIIQQASPALLQSLDKIAQSIHYLGTCLLVGLLINGLFRK